MKKTTSKSPLLMIISSLLISTPYQTYASKIPTYYKDEIASLTPHDRDTGGEEALEFRIRKQLELCISNFSLYSYPWYAFTDALGELDEFGYVLSPFTTDALEDYNINYPESHCYRANEGISELI